MDLTTGLQQIQNKFNAIKRISEQYLTTQEDTLDSIIDVSQIQFDDDETWLCSCNNAPTKEATSLSDWLYSRSPIKPQRQESPLFSKSDNQRNIDTRTFTRPKKKFTRPSIEKYNQELYGIGDSLETVEAGAEGATQPLHFDLAQPTSSYYFENILAKANNEEETFQNMSPPSLVNSMCSSTFANLMESSFIKNDPVLREIRDKDYTDSILLQDLEPPLFQSFTDSFSSVNSDSPESFLKKHSFNNSSNRSGEKINTTFDLNIAENNNTYVNVSDNKLTENVLQTTYQQQQQPRLSNEHQKDRPLDGSYGATYRRVKHSNTFRKSDLRSDTLNATFQMSPNDVVLVQDESDAPQTIIAGDVTVTKENSEILRRQLNGTLRHVNDSNKFGYRDRSCDGQEEEKLDGRLKRNSIGSADSLDRMSSLSNSSRGSNKMLNMADVDAIVEMQEKSLQCDVMSTPKHGVPTKKWNPAFLSPIRPMSDSDGYSSNEEYKSAKSTSSKTSVDHQKQIKPIKSLNFEKIVAKNRKPLPKTIFTAPSAQKMPQPLRGSYSNLKAASNLAGSQSNLKTMGQKLKGSYTSLRPISQYLPVAPPPLSRTALNTTSTLIKATNPNVTQIVDSHPTQVAEVHPIPRVPSNAASLKPRMSGLPRPISSGLPRPVSKIPAMRSNFRPLSRK